MYSLEKLCSIDAVSGKEDKIVEFLCDAVKQIGCDSHVDKFGNFVLSVDNKADVTVMLDAHIDQIGLVVKEIDDDGFIKFVAAGGVDTSILPVAEVVVHGKKDLFGVIGTKPLGLKKPEDNNSEIDDFYIDCGMSAEDIKTIVMPGDTISFVSEYTQLANGYVSSKSLDNRVGVFVVLECISRLVHKKLPVNIIGLFSRGEESGCNPAGLATDLINPDYAIVVDVTFGDTPYTNEEDSFKTGNGVTVAVGPSLDRKLNDRLLNHCNQNKITVSKEVCGKNPGTNAWSIQVAGDGVKCVVISVPIKYMHSTVETVNTKDINTAVEVICSALEGGVFNA